MNNAAVKMDLPLAADADGVIRVGGTRVRLETVLFAFNEGATPEEIVQDYPPLQLADVYAVIGYYLRERAAVEIYLQQRAQLRAEIRQANEARFDQTGIRARLLARREHQAV
jgi:uncharacterized protein (DUF433 family)